MRRKIQQRLVDVPIEYGADQNVWLAIPVDPQLQQQLRQVAFGGDDLNVLRWLLQTGAQNPKVRCSIGWYRATRRGLQYMADRAQVPLELIAITSAIFSSRTPVDLNILATQLWDVVDEDVWRYSRFRTDLQKSNIEKFLKMRKGWQELITHPSVQGISTEDLAKVWLFALTRPNWIEIVQDELPSVYAFFQQRPTVINEINRLVEPITMYGKTGNYALNLMGYTGLITVDTHMFKPVFGTSGLTGDLGTILHDDKEIYQSFSEDYTDILEELADEIGLTGLLGYDYTPAGLQAMVWVMRQLAGQDFTKPVGFHRFHRFKDALADDFFRPSKRKTTTIEKILTELRQMADKPKGAGSANAEDVQRWRVAFEELWIQPMEAFLQHLRTLKANSQTYPHHPYKIRQPKRILMITEPNRPVPEFDERIEGMIEQIHKLKVKGEGALGEIQPILKTELRRLANIVNQSTDFEKTVADLASASVRLQEAIHLPHRFASPSQRAKAIHSADKGYQRGREAIVGLLKALQQHSVEVPFELFISLITQSNRATLNAFWKRMFPEAKLRVGRNNRLEVFIPEENITLTVSTVPVKGYGSDKWFAVFRGVPYSLVLDKPPKTPQTRKGSKRQKP